MSRENVYDTLITPEKIAQFGSYYVLTIGAFIVLFNLLIQITYGEAVFVLEAVLFAIFGAIMYPSFALSIYCGVTTDRRQVLKFGIIMGVISNLYSLIGLTFWIVWAIVGRGIKYSNNGRENQRDTLLETVLYTLIVLYFLASFTFAGTVAAAYKGAKKKTSIPITNNPHKNFLNTQTTISVIDF